MGGSVRQLVLQMSSRRITSPEQVIERLRFKSSDMAALLPEENRYKQGLLRYLRGKGIVRHRLIPDAKLLEEEKAISEDDSCARALMFLLTVTGAPQLPREEVTILVRPVSSHASNNRSLTCPDTFLRRVGRGPPDI